jgi:hypothetical protein
MAFPQVPSRGTGSANAGALVVVIPGAHASGDLVFIVLQANPTTTDWTPTSGTTGWSQSLDNNGKAVFFKQIGASEADPSFDLSASGRSAYSVLRITGFDTILVQERGSQATGTSTAPNSGGLTPVGGPKDFLWISVAGTGDGRASFSSAPLNYTDLNTLATAGAGNGCSVATAERELNTTVENPGAFTTGRSVFWTAFTFAIHPVAVAGATVGKGLTDSILLGGKLKKFVG